MSDMVRVGTAHRRSWRSSLAASPARRLCARSIRRRRIWRSGSPGPSLAHPLRPRRARPRHPRARARRARASRFWSASPSCRVSAAVGHAARRRSPATSAGCVDDVISRVIDMLLAFPGLLLAIALVAVLGPSLANVCFALTIIGWVGYARLVRGQVLRAREFEYVQAARALGASAAAHPRARTSSRRRFRPSSCRRRSAWPARSSAKRR